MIAWLWWHGMNILGYRRVWYFPSDCGLPLGDFCRWRFAPSLDRQDYTEHNFPGKMYWGQ